MKLELTVGLKIRASVIEILRFCTIIRFFYFAFVGGREKYQKEFNNRRILQSQGEMKARQPDDQKDKKG